MEMVDYTLQVPWTFWCDYQVSKRGGADDWTQNLHTMCTIGDVPSLLYALENIEPLPNWPPSSNIHFFRDYIKPAWEDINNIHGGKWIMEFKKDDLSHSVDIQNIWKKTVALCASEILDNDVLCGCVFSPRRVVNRFALWTSTKSENVTAIGKKWLSLLNLHEKHIIFRQHKDALEGGIFWNKSSFEIN